jgi:hypothetical protein
MDRLLTNNDALDPHGLSYVSVRAFFDGVNFSDLEHPPPQRSLDKLAIYDDRREQPNWLDPVRNWGDTKYWNGPKGIDEAFECADEVELYAHLKVKVSPSFVRIFGI